MGMSKFKKKIERDSDWKRRMTDKSASSWNKTKRVEILEENKTQTYLFYMQRWCSTVHIMLLNENYVKGNENNDMPKDHIKWEADKDRSCSSNSALQQLRR